MKNKKDLKIFLIYLFVLLPTTIIFLEGGAKVFNTLFKENQKTKVKVSTRFDTISGFRYCQDKDLDEISYSGNQCNNHGFSVTPYQSNSQNAKKNIGILLSGNSTAKGEGITSKKNIKAFPGQLEKYLRKGNQLVDLINVSENGYTSWQEHTEITRYLNAHEVNNDLPSIKIIISFGGMVDFLTFVKLLRKGNLNGSDYMRANGLMIHEDTLDFANIYQKVLNGNLLANINLVMQAITSGIKENSDLFALIQEPYNAAKKAFKKEDSNYKNVNFNDQNSKIEEGIKLGNIIKKFNLEEEDYNFIKEYITDSVVRNYRASSSLSDSKFVFAYAPSFFSGFDKSFKKNEPTISINKEKGEYLHQSEIKEIEKDYRETLLKKLRASKNILVIDYSQVGDSQSWFYDNTHFNIFGSKKMAKIVSNDLLNILNNLD